MLKLLDQSVRIGVLRIQLVKFFVQLTSFLWELLTELIELNRWLPLQVVVIFFKLSQLVRSWHKSLLKWLLFVFKHLLAPKQMSFGGLSLVLKLGHALVHVVLMVILHFMNKWLMLLQHLVDFALIPSLLFLKTSFNAFFVFIKEFSEIIELLFRLGIQFLNLFFDLSIFFIKLSLKILFTLSEVFFITTHKIFRMTFKRSEFFAILIS